MGQDYGNRPPRKPAVEKAGADPLGDNGPLAPAADLRLEKIVSRVLRTGVLTCLVLVGIGFILLAFHPAGAMHMVLPFREIFPAMIRGQGTAFIDLGILVLLATPLARVIITGIGFAWQREWPFALISLAVLLILVASIIIGSH